MVKRTSILILAIALSACGSRFECDDRGLIIYPDGQSPSVEALSSNIDLQLRRARAEQSGSQWIDRQKLARAKGCRPND